MIDKTGAYVINPQFDGILGETNGKDFSKDEGESETSAETRAYAYGD